MQIKNIEKLTFIKSEKLYDFNKQGLPLNDQKLMDHLIKLNYVPLTETMYLQKAVDYLNEGSEGWKYELLANNKIRGTNDFDPESEPFEYTHLQFHHDFIMHWDEFIEEIDLTELLSEDMLEKLM